MIIIYILIFFFLMSFAITDYLLRINYFSYASAILMALFSGLRNISVGFDTINYYSDYDNIKNGFSFLHSTEYGYVLLEKICAFFGMNAWMFILLISFISLIGLCIAYGDMLPSYLVGSALCYYYARFFVLRDMNQIRSSLASVILLFSFKYVKEEKFFKFVLLIFVASSIHTGAFIALLVYPIYLMMLKLGTMYKLVSYLLLVFMSILFSGIISPLLNKVTNIINRGSAYINNQVYSNGSGLANPVLYYQLIIVLLIILKARNNKELNCLVSGYLLSTLVLILCNQYTSLAGRMSTFTATVEPVLFIYLLRLYLPKYLRIPFYSIVVVLMFIVINYTSGTIPKMGNYITIFN